MAQEPRPRLVLGDWRGLDLRLPPDQLSPSLLTEAKNLYVDRGTLRVRGGRSKYNSAEVVADTAIQGIHKYYPASGTAKVLVACGGDLYHASAGTFTEVTDTTPASLNGSTTANYAFVTLGDVVIFCDGTNGPYQYDGTNWAEITELTAPTTAPTLARSWLVLQACNAPTGWASSDAGNTAISANIAIKWKGAASLQIETTAGASTDDRVYYDFGAGTQDDWSGIRHISFFVRSDRAGSHVKFGFSESADPASNEFEETFEFDIPEADTWIEVYIPIYDIADASKNSVRYMGFAITNDDVACSIFIDNIQQSGGLNGEYEYRYSYYNSTSAIESASSPSTVISVEGPKAESVTVSGWSNPATSDKVRIYRRGGVSSVWRLVTTIDDTDSSYQDVLAEHLIGAEQDPNWGAPPACAYLAGFKNRVAYAGNSTYPSRLYVSNYEQPTRVPNVTFYEANEDAGFYVEVGENDGDKITGLCALEDRLLIFKHNSIWELVGTSFRDFALRKLTEKLGCASHWSIAQWQNGVLWFTGKEIATLDADGLAIVSDPVESYVDDVDDADGVVGVIHDQRYYVFYSDSDAAYNSKGLVYDLRREGWTRLTGWDVRCALELPGAADTRQLYLGDAALGTVWNADTGTTDNASAIAWELRTPELIFGDAVAEKRVREYVIVGDNSDEFLSAKIEGDEGATLRQRTHHLQNVRVGHEDAPATTQIVARPPTSVQGRRLRMTLSGEATTAVEIHRIEIEPQVLRR